MAQAESCPKELSTISWWQLESLKARTLFLPKTDGINCFDWKDVGEIVTYHSRTVPCISSVHSFQFCILALRHV